MFNDFFTSNSYWFRRPFLENSGYACIEKDGKLIIVINALGVKDDDLRVDIEGSYNPNVQKLKVEGNTKHSILDQNFRLSMAFNLYKPAKEVTYTLEDGLLTLEITFNEPVKPEVKVSKK